MNADHKKGIILGLGYVAGFYLKKNPHYVWTSRKLKENTENSFYFDLLDKDSWKNISSFDQILWTFPAVQNKNEIENCLTFFDLYLKNKNVIVLSTTSAYKSEIENEEINENSKLNLDEPRIYAEEELRKKGALILHLSGILGPERYPKNWYEKKRVKYGENILNYIHVEDIIYFTSKLFKNYKFYERFNLTSGDYKTHNQISKSLKYDAIFEFPNLTNGSKKVMNHKILEFLNENSYQFKKYPENCEI